MDARNFTVMNTLSGAGEIDLAALVASRPDSALAALLAAADLVLLIDEQGRIDQLHVGSSGSPIDAGQLHDWAGRAWTETALPDSADKITAMLADGATPRWREANHRIDEGEWPLQWLTIPLPGGRRLALGRDLRTAASLQQRLVRAQQAMERDSIRLRQLEARHRLLFDTAGEAIFIVDAGTRRVIEANAAARRLTGRSAAGLEGENFAALVHPDDHDSSIAVLGALTASEQRHPARLRLASGQAVQMTASLFRQDRDNRLMLRLHAIEPAAASPEPLADAMERMPDPFVLTDDNFDIIAGNGAFLDLVGLARPGDVVGQPIGRYLGRPGPDLGVMVAALRGHGLVRGFATMVRAAHATGHEGENVEVSAVSSGNASSLRHGFAIRLAARGAEPLTPPGALPMHQLTDLVGRVSLKEIVRESTDLIERLCIEAALTYTDDNRASAAEVLGLSRQSLYSKLHRHGLGNLGLGNLGDTDSSNDNS